MNEIAEKSRSKQGVDQERKRWVEKSVVGGKSSENASRDDCKAAGEKVKEGASKDTDKQPGADNEDVATITARHNANDIARDILRSGQSLESTELKVMTEQMVMTWKAGKNHGRRKVRTNKDTPVFSDTLGCTKDQALKTYHMSRLTDNYAQFVKVLNLYMYANMPEAAKEKFRWTTMTVNVGLTSKKHSDSGTQERQWWLGSANMHTDHYWFGQMTTGKRAWTR